MEKYINNFSVFFNKFKTIFDRNSSGNEELFDSECTTLFSHYSRNIDSLKPDCIKCMNYLKHLDDYNEPDYRDYQEQGIIYLYFWLHYYELKKRIYKKNTLDNFQKLMSSFETICQPDANIQNVYNTYIKNILNDELSDLFYLYEKFDNFQKEHEFVNTKCMFANECAEKYMSSSEKCKNYGNAYFCNELEKFRTKYNEYKPSVKECKHVQSYLPSCKNYSTSVIILISFITILVLSSLFFILYKFTPFGSCIRFRSKRTQRMYSNFTNEGANLLYTRGGSRTPEAKPYNIAYNSI
ncbi:PIR protein [Plasmodium vivax]|nr:PIR protein [Plasmodium vivax]